MNAGGVEANRALGIALLVAASCLLGCVDGIAKILAHTQSVGQIIWCRYALALPVVLVTTRPSAWRALFWTRRPRGQLLRGLAPLTISGGMTIGVRHLPLAETTVILFAGPILVVALSAPLLGEKVRPSSWIAVLVGFAAVVITARPGFSSLSHFALFPLAAAVFYAIFQLLTRRLAAAGEAPRTTLAWTLATGTLASTPLALLSWAPVDAHAWALMITLGIVFAVAQELVARAFAFAPAAVLTPFSYAQIAAAVVFGMAVFGDVPDWVTFVGIALIAGAGISVVRSGRAPATR
jgi:drug/metabolite transporter (DMT)-like permease